MPFQSDKQRRYLWANEPEIARDWTNRYGARGGGIMRVPFAEGDIVDDQGKVFEETEYTDLTQDQFNERFGGEYEENLTPWYEENTLEKMWQDPGRPKISQGLGTMRDWVADKFNWGKGKIGTGIGAGIDWSKMAMRGIGNFMAPGLGFLASALRRPDYPSDPMSKSFAYGAPNMGENYGYYNDLRHGNLTGQDQFGINTISRLGNYPAYYDQYARDYKAGKYTHGDAASKFNQRKYAHALAVKKANQKRIERDFTVTAEDDYGAGNYIAPTSVTVPAQGGNQGNGGAAAQAAGDLAGGRETWEASPFQRGGIASLWPR
jgi:hypothetical protein